MKLISGCLITKNESEFLRQSISSYIDYVDELIVVDDNSTDETKDIIASFPKTKLITGTYNGDKFTQRNEYLKHATGKWIICPDGDEVFFKSDIERIVKRMETDEDSLWIPSRLINFWKDMNHRIRGHHWDQWMQRIFRNVPGVGYYDQHHSVSLKPGLLLSRYAQKNGKTMDIGLRIPHYSYCKNAVAIKNKIRYYTRRDNPHVSTEGEVEDCVHNHPYFSEFYDHPRYGKKGLFCAGSHKRWRDRVDMYTGKHPKIMETHPKFKLYTEYSRNMNEYMETHWQVHNHLHFPKHQRRIKYVASFCKNNTLEIGCANGFSTHTMQQKNKNAVFTGVEPTDWGFATARRTYPNIDFYKAFGENLPFEDRSFDTVLLAEIIEHVDNPEELVAEAWRCCGSQLIVTAPAHKKGATCDPDHKRYFNEDMMRTLCKPICDGAKQVEFKGLDKDGHLTVDKNRYWFGITIIEK